MKTKLLILILGYLAFSSCEKSNTNCDETFKSNYPYEIYEVKYKGHEYIVFKGAMLDAFSGQSSGVVHNPECKKCKSETINPDENEQ